MNGNCHFVYGAAVGISINLALPFISEYLPEISNTPETATLMVLGGLVGGIFPDIDNPLSYVGKLTAPISTVIGKIGASVGKRGKAHRGVLHDPIVYLVGLALAYFNFTPVIGFFVGCLSHLYLDVFNPTGIPFLFGVKRLRLGKIPSGSVRSVIFTWLNVALAIAIGFMLKLRIFI